MGSVVHSASGTSRGSGCGGCPSIFVLRGRLSWSGRGDLQPPASCFQSSAGPSVSVRSDPKVLLDGPFGGATRPLTASPSARAPPSWTLRSYLQTARKHGVDGLDVLVQLFKGTPWMPPRAVSPP